MELIPVELKKSKFFAYHFDGKEESAKEFCRKFNLYYQKDFMDDDIFSITLPDNSRIYAGNFVVVDGRNFLTYTRDEFLNTYNVITDYRDRTYSFMTED